MQELSRSYLDLIYLLRCQLREEAIDDSYLDLERLDLLYQVAQNHGVEAMIYEALSRHPLVDSKILDQFHQGYLKVQRRHLLYEVERNSILKSLDQIGIWYVLLKGSVINAYYPKAFLRQMTDNDILFDFRYRQEVKELMISRGYEVIHFNQGYDDVYHKKPFFNFEMHIALGVEKTFKSYMKDIEKRLENNCKKERLLTKEELYLYHLAHEMKHYFSGGVGIRYLVDYFYFLKKEKDLLDWTFIHQKLKELGWESFFEIREKLVEDLFGDHKSNFELALKSESLIVYCIYGVHGNLEGKVDNQLKRSRHNSIISYYYHRILQDQSYYEHHYPLAARYPLCRPFVILWRLIKGIFSPSSWKELYLLIKKVRYSKHN